MSASVAPPTIGLLNGAPYSPSLSPVTPDAENDWDDHMEIDRPTEPELTKDAPKPGDNEEGQQRRQSKAETDRNEAIGSLLAALAGSGANPKSAPEAADEQTSTNVLQASALDETAEKQEQASAVQPKTEDEEGTASVLHHLRLPNEHVEGTNVTYDGTHPVLPLQPGFTEQTTLPFGKIPFPDLDTTMEAFPEIPLDDMANKKQYDAFARFEFADGIFYLNTYQCELGRDQHAYRDALLRDREAKEEAELAKETEQKPKSSSGGKASRRSEVIKTAESQVQGSVVSEAGGFGGVDDRPVEGYGDRRSALNGISHSSQASESSTHVRPADLFNHPALQPFDYNKTAYHQEQQNEEVIDNEQPAPVTAEHMPNPESCPLIPIHTTLASNVSEIESLKAISRRHVKIYWSFKHSAFYMEILGRNGAFLNNQWFGLGEHLQLSSGAKIQISAVEFTFRLPVTQVESVSADSPGTPEDVLDSVEDVRDESETPQKIKLKLNIDAATGGQNGETKRRGPGRPPKNGYMSQREMKEVQKAEKEAKARVANGNKTPPPAPATLQRKPSKSQLTKSELMEEPDIKPQTKKRPREEEGEEVVASIEGADEPSAEVLEPASKRQKSKSPSPPYKPFEDCTQEDLARPPHNYAVLLYMILSEQGQMRLNQIYRAMKQKWLYFKYMTESDGWQSSVRHNLNQECGKLFLKGPKEGKGYKWYAKPNAMEEYQAQKNKRSNAATAPKPRPPQQKPAYPPSHGQQLTWQNQAPAGTANGFGQQAAWSQQAPGTNPSQPGGAPNGQMRPLQQAPAGGSLPGQRPSQSVPAQQQSSMAPPTQPVNTDGLRVIYQFEKGMMSRIPQTEEHLNKWKLIFQSARQRCLHGAPESLVPENQRNEEDVIMTHMNNFIKQYPNPNFSGFRNKSPLNINAIAGAAALAATAVAPPSASPAPAPTTSTPAPTTSTPGVTQTPADKANNPQNTIPAPAEPQQAATDTTKPVPSQTQPATVASGEALNKTDATPSDPAVSSHSADSKPAVSMLAGTKTDAPPKTQEEVQQDSSTTAETPVKPEQNQ